MSLNGKICPNYSFSFLLSLEIIIFCIYLRQLEPHFSNIFADCQELTVSGCSELWLSWMPPLPFLHGRWKDLNILFPKISCRMNLFLRSSLLLDFIQLQCRLNDRMEGSEIRSVNLGNRKISCQGHNRLCCCRSDHSRVCKEEFFLLSLPKCEMQ